MSQNCPYCGGNVKLIKELGLLDLTESFRRKCTIPDTYCYDRLRCEIYNRLAEIEEKLESRKLVELTYKKGDSVFFISWLSGNVCEGTVVDWQEDGGYCIVGGDDMISAYECFSTKEAAEARLKELQDKEDCP